MDDHRSDTDASPTDRNAPWRLRAVTNDDLDEIAYLQACADAEHSAFELIESARHEAVEQGELALHHAQLAMEHAARQLELLHLADRAERTIGHSNHLLFPHHDPPSPPD